MGSHALTVTPPSCSAAFVPSKPRVTVQWLVPAPAVTCITSLSILIANLPTTGKNLACSGVRLTVSDVASVLVIAADKVVEGVKPLVGSAVLFAFWRIGYWVYSELLMMVMSF